MPESLRAGDLLTFINEECVLEQPKCAERVLDECAVGHTRPVGGPFGGDTGSRVQDARQPMHEMVRWPCNIKM